MDCAPEGRRRRRKAANGKERRGISNCCSRLTSLRAFSLKMEHRTYLAHKKQAGVNFKVHNRLLKATVPSSTCLEKEGHSAECNQLNPTFQLLWQLLWWCRWWSVILFLIKLMTDNAFNAMHVACRFRYSSYRYKLLKWWAQSFLPGVPRVVAGFRDHDGVVVSVETFHISKISQMIKVCLDSNDLSRIT